MAVYSYLAYLAVGLAATWWMSRAGGLGSRAFLAEAFPANEPLQESINRLRVTAFALIALAGVALGLPLGDRPGGRVEALEHAAWKIGLALWFLGAVHWFNVYALFRLRGKMRRRREQGGEPNGGARTTSPERRADHDRL